MRPRDIDRFFTQLAREVDFPLRIILTGGAVAVLEGSARATQDLDFQITLSKSSGKNREKLQTAIEKVMHRTGMATQYDEAIETWGSIAWPRRPTRGRLYKRYGTIEVYLLDPLLWSIGKLSRYLAGDVEDLKTVFKRIHISPEKAVRAWGEALGKSPLSSAQPLFKRQVLHFLREHGPSIWGKALKITPLETLFLASARQTKKD